MLCVQLVIIGVHEMAKASGCLTIETQLRRARSKLHVLGLVGSYHTLWVSRNGMSHLTLYRVIA